MIFILSLLLSNNTFARELLCNTKIEIGANPSKGFYWPYIIYIPGTWLTINEHPAIIIYPNNTGKINDDYAVHKKSADILMDWAIPQATGLNVIALVPIFPRSEKDWQIYTHALNRALFFTNNDSLKRLDQQLIAMINDAKKKLADKQVNINPKILISGFSASGMFADRFTIIHPELVMAAAIGSPGGWPIVPVDKYNNDTLNYPIGIADLKKITGNSFDEEKYKKIKQFFYIGEKDENDSVPYDDSYDFSEREIVIRNFGKNLLYRWKIASGIFESLGYENVQFTIYPNTGHLITKEIQKEIHRFFANALKNY